MLTFPNPESFTQYVRQVRRGTRNSILVVEGITDKRALMPLLDPSVVVIPADGKDKLVAAFDGLTGSHRNGVAFILDCDGETHRRLKGHLELVITTNRDVEADLILIVGAFRRVAFELLAQHFDARKQIEDAAEAIVDDASFFATKFGLVRVTAVRLGLRVKLQDCVTRRKRAIRPSDLVELSDMLMHSGQVSIDEISTGVGAILGWSDQQVAQVVEACVSVRKGFCIRHGERCVPCQTQRYCGGHVLVDVLPALVLLRYGVVTNARVLDSHLRIASSSCDLAVWGVPERLRKWQEFSGQPLMDWPKNPCA